MKEPWQIFHDELQRELRRLARAGGTETPKEKFEKAVRVTAEAVADHLTGLPGWDDDQATDVALELVRALRAEGDSGVKERLRHAYTDWSLRRKR